ncbi:MAG: hypothetical protein R6U32_07460 [Candidatus Woesearchaeota archaeon]
MAVSGKTAGKTAPSNCSKGPRPSCRGTGMMTGLRKGPGRGSRKGQIWISAVLYVLMTAVIMVVVLEAGLPVLKEMRDKAVFVQSRDNLISLNQHIKEVGSAGPGSQRTVPLQVQKGHLEVGKEKLRWYMDTEADIIEPMSKISMGDVKIASDSDVDAHETGGHYILENFYMLAAFNKLGNASSYENISSDSIIDYMQFKGTGAIANGTFDLSVDDEMVSGEGYTSINDKGYDQGRASVTAFVNTTSGTNYTIIFTMHGNSDYMTVRMR